MTVNQKHKANAKEMGVSYPLYMNWVVINTFIKGYFEKNEYEYSNPPNCHKIERFTVIIFFVNNKFIELVMEYRKKEITKVKIPRGKVTDKQLVFLSLIIENTIAIYEK